MSFLDRFRRKKEDEASRIDRLSKTGRMADGEILDAISDDAGTIRQVTYSYTLAGVHYESSQELSASQQKQSTKYAPGRQIVVRYDPKQPANSIVV
jgi:TusA-related sulfurtransferase